jgi:RNA polymerase sigma factor (sigma-70 family)
MDGQEMAVAVIVAYLIEKFLPALTKRFGKSPIAHRIEDVLQDGLVNIHVNKKQYDPARGRFDVWAYRIVLNCAYDEIERIKHDVGTVDFDLGLLADDSESIGGGDGSPSPSVSCSEKMSRKRLLVLRQIMMGLPEDEQKMLHFFAHHRDDHWQRAYAELTGMNASTLRSRFWRTISKVRDAITRAEQGEYDHE